MNLRLTTAAAIAVVLASFSEFFLINGVAWLITTIGAVLMVALAGTLTRLAPVPAAAGATVLGGLAAIPMLAATPLAWKAAGVAIVACCAVSATGWRPLRLIAGLITYLAALLLYLNAVRASSASVGLIVPTRASLHHLAVLASSGRAAAKSMPPVAQTAGVIVLAAGGIGLAAILIDLLAVRLRKPAIAGLPLLVIYLAPITTAAHVQGPWAITAFLTAATGYLVLLASDGRARLRGWGRVVSVWHNHGENERLGGVDVTALATTGRRIGVAALCVAVVAPLLLPSLNLHKLFSGGPGKGTGSIALPDPVIQLHGLLTETRPQTVLSYTAYPADPGQYLQVYVLNYDSQQAKWTLVTPTRKTAANSPALPLPSGISSSMPLTVVTLRISSNLAIGYAAPLQFLPVPYWPDQLQASGSWWEADDTQMIFAGRVGEGIRNYLVTSQYASPTPAMLTVPQRVPAALKPYLAFKSPVASELLKIAKRVTAGQTTAFGRAVALERWFHSAKFTYSLESNLPNTPQGLLEFLTTDPQGYCQQFAFAMAVLARLLGIPSRVAVGYTAGTLNKGRWVVTTSDAHAWPELYFQGAGWLRFEPTPGGTAGQGSATEPSYVTKASTSPSGKVSKSGHSVAPSTLPGGKKEPGSLSKILTLDHAQDLSGGKVPGIVPSLRRGGSDSGMLAGLIALAVVLLAAGSPAVARLVARRRRWRVAAGDAGLAYAAWREVRADLSDLGMPCRPSDSPRAVARQVCSATDGDDAARQAIDRIATVVEHAYYAAAPAPASTVRADAAVVRRSLSGKAHWTARWRARLMPASILGPLRRNIGQRLGSITGWVPIAREEA